VLHREITALVSSFTVPFTAANARWPTLHRAV